MWFNDSDARAAFRRGAREAFDSCVIQMDVRQKHAVTTWLAELDDWEGGEEPPEPPRDW